MFTGEPKNFQKNQSSESSADYLIPFLIIVFILIISLASFAQAQTTANQISLAETIPATKKNWSINLISEFSTNMFTAPSSSKKNAFNLWILPSIKLSGERKLSLTTILSQEFTTEQKTKLSNTRLDYSLSPIDTKNISTTIIPALVLPTDNDLLKNDTYHGALSITFSNSLKFLKSDIVKIAYAPRFTKNLHKYNTNNEFRANTSYSIRHRGTGSIQVSAKVGIGLTGDWIQTWTYRGVQKQSFLFNQELNYAISESLTASIAHGNEGAAKRAGGAGSNVALFDENTSEISAGLSYVF